MGFPLRGKLLSCQATLMHGLDCDGDSPRLHISRWTIKKERNSRKPLRCVRDFESDIISTSTADKCSKRDRRPRTPVSQLPHSIIKLVRLLVKKTVRCRRKARTSETWKGKQRSLAAGRDEYINKKAAPTAASRGAAATAAALTAAAVAAAVTGERGAQDTVYSRRPAPRPNDLQIRPALVTVQQGNHQFDCTLWRRPSARIASNLTTVTASASAPASRTETIDTSKCYRSSSRGWCQNGMWQVLEGRRRSWVKDTRYIVAEKLCLLLKGCLTVSVLSHCICKRTFDPTAVERKALKNRVSFPQALMNEDKDDTEQVDEKEKESDGVRDEELTPEALENRLGFCCCYTLQNCEDTGASVSNSRRSLFPLVSSLPISALCGEGGPLCTIEGKWEMASFLYARGHLLNQINTTRRQKNASHSHTMQSQSRSLPSAARTREAAQRQIPAAAEEFPVLPSNIQYRYSSGTRMEEERELRKANSLATSNFCCKKTSCTLQGTEVTPHALKVADTVCTSDSRLLDHVGIQGGPLKVEILGYKGPCTNVETALPQGETYSVGNADPPLMQPRSRVRENRVTQKGEVCSGCYRVPPEGSRLKHPVVDTRCCRSSQLQQHIHPIDVGIQQQTGSSEESAALTKSSSKGPAPVHVSLSRRQWVKEYPFLRSRRCVLWECYSSPREKAEVSSTTCFLPERRQQPALHPRRSILVEKNKMLLDGVNSRVESPLQQQCQRQRARHVLWIWKHLLTRKNQKRRVRLRFESLECIAYYSMHQPPAANAFYRYTRLSTQVYFGDKALRPPLQPRKKAAKELKSGMTAEEAIQWSLSTKNPRNRFMQCNAI